MKTEQDDHLRWLWRQWDDYFRHKENLSQAIILIEAGLLAFLIVTPVPEWFKQWQCNRVDDFFSYLPVILFVLFASFMLLAHIMVIFQLNMRKAADAWADGVRLVLTKWSCADSITGDKPLTEENLRDLLKAPERCGLRKLLGYLVPMPLKLPSSNSDSLWKFVPGDVATEVSNLYKDSFAKLFEKIVALVSISLLLLGSGVSFARTNSYLSDHRSCPYANRTESQSTNSKPLESRSTSLQNLPTIAPVHQTKGARGRKR